jgi:hypothetical protein
MKFNKIKKILLANMKAREKAINEAKNELSM